MNRRLYDDTSIKRMFDSSSKVVNEMPPLGRKDRICRTIIEWGILGLIVFSPLPAASVFEWSILVIELGVLLMMVAYLFMSWRAKAEGPVTPGWRWQKFLLSGLFAVVVIQILPFPAHIIRSVAPNSYAFQQNFSVSGHGMKFLTLSLIPAHTLREGLELLSYFLLGFLIVKTITKKTQMLRIILVLVGVGVFEAFYGMFELFNKNPRILFYRKVYWLDSVTGTFVNRNHFSGFMEMIIPMALGLIVSRIVLFWGAGLSWREKLFRISEKGLAVNILMALGIITMSVAVLYSKSRAGVFLLFFTFLLFFLLSVLHFKEYSRRHRPIRKFLALLFLIIIVISGYIGMEATMQRFALDKILEEQRPVFWANTIRIFGQFPIFGTGLGTFAEVYPDHYEEAGRPLVLMHAHNDYLEYLSELGGIGAGLLFGGVFLLVVLAYRGLKSRRNPEVKGLTLGGFVSIVCGLLHAFTDFILHIPANLLLFSVILSLTLVIAYRWESLKSSSSSRKLR